MKQDHLVHPSENAPGYPQGMSDSFVLSSGQERLWFLEQMAPGISAYNLAEIWRLRGILDVKALSGAVQDVVDRHESLRTSFSSHFGKPCQQVWPRVALTLELTDFSNHATPESVLSERLALEVRKPIDLGRAPLMRTALFRLSSEEHVFLVNLHHIISDEWSLGIILRELAQFYSARVGRSGTALAPLPLQYADFAVWQRHQLEIGEFAAETRYWKEQLAQAEPPVTLRPDRPRLAAVSHRGATLFRYFPENLARAIRVFNKTAGGTTFTILLAAFDALLVRYTGQEDITVGSLFAGREIPETEGMVGFFVNTHALRTDLRGDPSFSETLARVRETALGAMANARVPLDHIVQQVQPERVPASSPLFQTLFGLQPGATETWELPGLEATRIEADNGGAKFDLSVLATERPDGLRLRCEYNADLYDPQTITRFLRHFEILLEAAMENPSRKISELPLLTETERVQLLCEWNNTRRDYPANKCIHELFEEQTARAPQARALFADGAWISYEALDSRAEHIAGRLRAQGVGPEVRVCVCLPRTSALVAAVLGTLKAGGAYVPVDPGFPDQRVNFIVGDCQAALVLTTRELRTRFATGDVPVLCVEDLEDAPPSSLADSLSKPDGNSLAYVIYTSGSTGRPKGVALEHDNAVSMIHWAQRVFTSEELSGVLASTSICFDLSIFELFVPLSCGGAVVLAENALSLPATATAPITLINTVPSAMRELLRLQKIPASVLVINLAGEKLEPQLVDRLYAETSVRKVYDLYGPTETTTYSTYALRKPGTPATIGVPLDNEQVFVLDRHLQPVPIGVAGELCIAGAGVARGYLNLPDLTAARFLSTGVAGSGRLYRTGDSARWRNDGSLEFLGRTDHQVKVRGYRIELGEIESVLRSQEGIRDAVVVSYEPRAGDKALAAYIIADDSAALSVQQVRDLLRLQLPEYMLPTSIMFCRQFPTTTSGKVDRSRLPDPGLAVETPPAASVAPGNAEEEALLAIWQDVLGRNGFGVHDNFFQLGGHSLLATQVISRIALVFKVEIPLRTVFEAPTVARLAKAITQTGTSATSHNVIPRRMTRDQAHDLLARLDSLSDDEVESLLKETEVSGFVS